MSTLNGFIRLSKIYRNEGESTKDFIIDICKLDGIEPFLYSFKK